MNRLLLAPHPDDAVWSCGGMLARWCGEGELTVVTVFDGDGAGSTGRGASTTATADGPAARRRAEDATALGRWPLHTAALGLAEATLRYDGEGRPLYAGPLALRRAPHPLDATLTAHLAGLLRPLTAECDELLLPLAVRTHVDHRLVRDAAELALRAGRDGADPAEADRAPAGSAEAEPRAGRPRVRYYREFPYAPPPPAGGYEEHSEAAEFGDWLRGSLVYESQVRGMFGGAHAFARALARRTGTPRHCTWTYWVRTAK